MGLPIIVHLVLYLQRMLQRQFRHIAGSKYIEAYQGDLRFLAIRLLIVLLGERPPRLGIWHVDWRLRNASQVNIIHCMCIMCGTDEQRLQCVEVFEILPTPLWLAICMLGLVC